MHFRHLSLIFVYGLLVSFSLCHSAHIQANSNYYPHKFLRNDVTDLLKPNYITSDELMLVPNYVKIVITFFVIVYSIIFFFYTEFYNIAHFTFPHRQQLKKVFFLAANKFLYFHSCFKKPCFFRCLTSIEFKQCIAQPLLEGGLKLFYFYHTNPKSPGVE